MKKPTLMVGAGALALLVVAVGLSLRPGSDPAPALATPAGGPAVARLGNQQIDLTEMQSVLASLPAETREQLRGNRGALETWLRSRLAQKAVLEQADAQGWRQRPEVEQQTRAATEQIVFRDYMLSVSQVPAGYPSAAELQQAYDAGKAQWVTPPMVRVSQIFLAVNDPQSAEAVRRQAQELSRKAQATPGDFAALATQYSQDPNTAQRGGDSGMQPLQQLVPQVREAVARLKVGGVSGAWVFVSEHVPARHIGYACGTLTAGLTFGILLGSLTATAVNTALTAQQVLDYGWRIPFVLGGVFGLGAMYLRRWLRETPVFTELQQRRALAAELPLKAVLREHRGLEH